jgi:hypothetical protein
MLDTPKEMRPPKLLQGRALNFDIKEGKGVTYAPAREPAEMNNPILLAISLLRYQKVK